MTGKLYAVFKHNISLLKVQSTVEKYLDGKREITLDLLLKVEQKINQAIEKAMSAVKTLPTMKSIDGSSLLTQSSP